ncbi:hypothetical protein [Methanimicrococcus hongohii]|uniref:hypothetical protein n=1 Tax=Methanimicrococcus hongohii TaxID=3028295 RepID=UPI00292E17A5|nr:hypothetical protein [Methanimicrococcus sp. Hf6]
MNNFDKNDVSILNFELLSVRTKCLLTPVFCCQLPAKPARLQLFFNVAAANQVCVAACSQVSARQPPPRASRSIFLNFSTPPRILFYFLPDSHFYFASSLTFLKRNLFLV